MKTIIIATKNKGKVKDFEEMFSQYNIQVKSLYDFPEIEDVKETGKTFEENAKLKAEEICKVVGQPVLADDSGLMIDALDGRPGVYSARYAGEEKSDQKNIEKVLQELKGVEDSERTARFYCALAVATPNEETVLVSGTCDGKITEVPTGENGFGYDPVFYLEEKDKTMAQLTKEEKNQISHRANALNKLELVIKEKWQ